MDYASSPATLERTYVASPARYERGGWRAAGASGVRLPPLTVGTWQNFSDLDPREAVRELYTTAIDNGVFSFDFGNNYGRPPGSAEALFGAFLTDELRPYRRELIIATKAGYDMWPGPHGVGSSLKYLLTSLDESLKRLKLDYVDVFYSHRHDPGTPIEETAEALDLARRSGRCLYVGISSYPAEQAQQIDRALSERGTRLLINQSHYNLLSRGVEAEVLEFCRARGIGFAAFSPLAQGLLSDKYLEGLPTDSRASRSGTSVPSQRWDRLQKTLAELKEVAMQRGQSIAQLALSWTLRDPVVSTAVIGVRTKEQLLHNLHLDTAFSAEEGEKLRVMEDGLDVDLWPVRTEGAP